MKHPIQPLETDGQGTIRFKKNAIVDYILHNGGIDMNRIACMSFSNEDREQFAQLIGYSLDGYADLSYASADTYNAACAMQNGMTTAEARAEVLQAELDYLRETLREPVARLFGKHPDDLSMDADRY